MRHLISLLFCITNIYAINNLSVRDDDAHPDVKKGYIDEAVLVVEPYGAYSDQSIYIKYSDHNQFSNKRVLITHLFELPEGAVVNDLWLWIGDSIMQAQIFERKHAQGIWDTITSFKRDPAFLQIDNFQYTLCVYPLVSGNYRKTKINYVIPTKYIQKKAYIDLSYKYLASDNNLKTPLRILFRVKDDSWGVPVIEELPELKVSKTIDTLGKKYNVLLIPDIKSVSSLTLSYDLKCVDGSFSSIAKSDTNLYFTFGMYEREYFNTHISNNNNKKSFIGLDISGIYGVNPDSFVKDISTFCTRYLNKNDTVKIVLAGDGIIDTFPPQGWKVIDSSTLSQTFKEISNGKVIAAKKKAIKPRILFADMDVDNGGWRFNGIEKLANVKVDNNSSLLNSMKQINDYDIITSYMNGFNSALSDKETDSLKKSLDSFFEKGGVFLCLYSYNRDNNHIAKKYFKGLVKPKEFVPTWLHRNINGPIGYGFPQSFRYDNSAPLICSDSDAVNELLDDKGQPVVISKKIGKGRFILTSLWHRQDNEGLKGSLCTVLLNLQNQSKYWQLGDVLSNMSNTFNKEPFSEAVIMSNSDKMVTSSNCSNILKPLDLNTLCRVTPVKAINFLDGQDYYPPIYTLNNDSYFGSSYCLKYISEKTNGIFLSRHIDKWDYMGDICSKMSSVQFDSFKMDILADKKPVNNPYFKVLPNLEIDRMKFIACKTPVADSVNLSFVVKLKNSDSIITKSTTLYPKNLDNSKSIALRTMYENEILKRMLSQSQLDTLAIIKFAMSHRILNDFTAFLALEPNDTNHYMREPTDESDIGTIVYGSPSIKLTIKEFIFHILYEKATIKFKLISGCSGYVQIKIFNLLGKTIAEKEIKLVGNAPQFFVYNKSFLGNGTYIAVAKFFPSGESGQMERKLLTLKITR